MPEEKPQQSNTPNFNELELGILKFWKDNQIFEKSLKQSEGREPYIFYDGPPFATGLPHYGSILPSVIKDAIPRYQTMKGKFVRRRWGWDCHGLPIENIVEQKLKISGKKQIEEIGVDKFNQACRENVLAFAQEWGKVIDRVARWVDFENSYKTMDTSYMESVWWGLKQIWDKGLIYEDRKVLLSEMAKKGPKVVVITDGIKGAYAYDGHMNEYWFMPIYPDPKPPLSRTGAGDAFASTFTVASILGKSVPEALRWAPINSAFVVQQDGAQRGLLTRAALEEYLASAPKDYRPQKI